MSKYIDLNSNVFNEEFTVYEVAYFNKNSNELLGYSQECKTLREAESIKEDLVSDGFYGEIVLKTVNRRLINFE